jgi:hypothetical protein
MARTATGVVVEDTRRRAPKVAARAPQTLSGSDARWNDERPVVDPAVRTSLGGGRGEAYQRNATDNHPRVALITRRWVDISTGVCSACLRVEEALEMTDEDRIARLVAEIEDLPFEKREAVIASLSDDDRSAVWDAQLNESEGAVPEDDEELGGEA